MRHIYGLYMQEFSNLVSDNIKHYIESSRRGLNYFKAAVFDEIRRRDLHLGGICQTRKLSVCNKQSKFIWAEDSPVPKSQQKEISRFLDYNFDRFDLVNFIANNNEAEIQGITIFEINYEPVNGQTCIKDVRYIPNHLLCYDDINEEYKFLNLQSQDVTRMRTLAWNTTVDRVNLDGLVIPDINPLKLLVVKGLDGNAQNGFLNGCHDALIWAWFFKSYGIKDWSTFNEKFANPAVIIKRPTIMGKEDITKLETTAQNFERLFRGVFPDGVTIDLLEYKSMSATTNLFDTYLKYFDAASSIRVLGQTLTTSIGDKGSRAAAQVHDMVRRDIEIADMLSAKNSMNKLGKRILDLNFPNLKDYPERTFEEEDDVDFKLKRSEIFKNLRTTGYIVSQPNVEDEFDVTVEPDTTTTTERISENIGGTPAAEKKYVDKFIENYFSQR